MTQPPNYDWVREMKPDLKQMDAIPLTGATPPFPWEEFSSRLARSFDRQGVKIEPDEVTWRTKETLYEGLGDSPFPLIFSVAPLQGQVCWVMPEQEMAILAPLLLTNESHPLSFNDPALNKSFYQFLALEVLYNLTQISFDKSLTPILTSQTTLPNEDSLCWDISIYLQNQTLWGRLIISPEFRRSWVEHFAQKQESSALTQQMAQLVDVNVHLEVGRISLTLAEWKSVHPGDFILLDSCSLDPELHQGRVMLTLNGKNIFRAKLKNGSLKILELPLLHEVETPMENKQPEDEDDITEDEDFEDEDFLEDTEELFTEEEEEEELEETEAEAPTQAKAAAIAKPSEAAPAPSPKQKAISPVQIPLTLTVEIGQVQMTMDQLLKLEPGNLLEIDIHPENGVDLTINGKVVGKGELIRIGDALGVRVLHLGK